VGEVVKVMAKTKVLVKVRRELPTRPTPGRARPRPPLAAPRPSFPFANRARDRSPRLEIRPSFRRVASSSSSPPSVVVTLTRITSRRSDHPARFISKVHPEGKYVVDIGKDVDVAKLTAGARVALKNDSYALHMVLPSLVDPLVSLMKVEKVPDSTFDMIGGLDQQVKEIKEVVELPIKHPELFESLGIAQPKGVILYGPPGTGKTLLARAVAHHTDCCFIRVSGSELVQKYIGEGARMVRELFVMARENAPAILFMDEVDSIGSARGSGGGDSEVQRTMLELLNQLDGFEASNQIKVIMATNRLDILDSALLRPGRIDRKIEFPNPTEDSRVDILKIHSRKMNLVRGIDLKKIASKMGGASGAESKAVCTEAGMFALRERRVHVTQEDFEMAVSKVMQKDSEKNISVAKLFT
jgi:26S proteasome regulatory subunit T6